MTRVNDYYRQNVYDTGGQKIGETIDILIEKQGQVPATMISVGSFLALTRERKRRNEHPGAALAGRVSAHALQERQHLGLFRYWISAMKEHAPIMLILGGGRCDQDGQQDRNHAGTSLIPIWGPDRIGVPVATPQVNDSSDSDMEATFGATAERFKRLRSRLPAYRQPGAGADAERRGAGSPRAAST